MYLPEGYNKKDTVKYPVIYLLDGPANEDYIHIVGVGKEGKNVNVFFDYLPDENHATIMHEAVSNSFILLYPVSTKD
jgi:predicted alpha/beta superfamily hydrolase